MHLPYLRRDSVMSCRAVGRLVEVAILSDLVRQANLSDIRFLVGTFAPTAENSMVADHCLKLGFTEVERSSSSVAKWFLDISEWREPEAPMSVRYL